MTKALRGAFVLIGVIIVFFSFFLSGDSLAAEVAGAGSGPIKITSDRLVANKKAGLVTFKGSVVARHKDGNIISDSLKVYYDGKDAVEKIVASGNVKINQQDRVGVCETAIFYPDEQKIVMSGEPRVWKDGDVVTGQVITIFGGSDRMDVEGASIVISPKEDKNIKAPSL
ncbi:MAG: LptA/OstA family protein [bacterium]|nr:LptA/OstA family protein [bacterium]